MVDKKIGFIGAGNMGGAIIAGLLKSNNVAATNIYAINHSLQSVQNLVNTFGINKVASIAEIAKISDMLVIGVKPKDVAKVLGEAAHSLSQHTVIISIAAGVTLANLEKLVASKHKIVRVMPNTPSLVGAGMSSITPNELLTEQELADVMTIFNSLGKAEIVPESMIDAVVGVSGSSPAYIFMLIEAMADGAVLGGMPRQQAYTFAAQAVLGSAKMVLETDKHVAELKDMVCSPAGTTIEAVKTLESRGFRAAIIEAIKSCMDKSAAMSKNTK